MRTRDGFGKMKYLITGLGAILLVPFVPTAFGFVNATAGSPSLNIGKSIAPFAGRQYANEDDARRPFVNRHEDESTDHARHEEEAQRLRERAHEFGERQEDRAERLKDRLNREHTEHERHEMNERHHKDN